MRFLVLFIAILYSNVAFTQDPLFLFVSFSDGVTIDNRTPRIGELIDETSKVVFIPKRGYALVIAREGEAYHLTSTISVDRVAKKLNQNNWLDGIGTTQRPKGCSAEIELIGVPHNQIAEIIGDSILVAIKTNRVQVNFPFIIEYKSMFNEILFSDSTNATWKVQRVNFNNEQAVIFGVTMGKYRSDEHLIKLVNTEQKEKLIREISKISEVGQSEILKLALFQFHNLYYDQVFLLHKFTVLNHRPENIILDAYVKNLREKYQFNLFDFHK